MNRRQFLKNTAAATAALFGVDLLSTPGSARVPTVAADPLAAPESVWMPPIATTTATRPNILVIVVDQLSMPQWFSAQAQLAAFLPNIARLRAGAVSFRNHFSAANSCTPARASLLTGLYAHQTGCLLTIGADATETPHLTNDTGTQAPNLKPAFPTWGYLLRQLGYRTSWYGKWHLSRDCDLEQYGFSGGTCPSPSGGNGQGLARDPQIADEFINWLQTEGSTGPWATTVSFVNPHDIAWYYSGTDQVPAYTSPPRVFTRLPPNFETPAQLVARTKPRAQLAAQETIANVGGFLPFEGEGFEAGWLKLLDLYLLMQQTVDLEIGRVLDALEAHPAASNTVIIFTSDHGEYAGAHGLRGKGRGIYEEAIRVPFYVKDLTGRHASQPDVERTQLTSHVDVTPLLLTLASGSNDWRSRPNLQYLERRLNMAGILRDPAAPGRSYVLHTTEGRSSHLSPEYADQPLHVIGYRTRTAKLGLYSHWVPGSITIEADGQQNELYDYRGEAGRLEVDNVAATDATLFNQMYTKLVNEIIPNELRAPLPAYLLQAQQAAFDEYFAAIAGD